MFLACSVKEIMPRFESHSYSYRLYWFPMGHYLVLFCIWKLSGGDQTCGYGSIPGSSLSVLYIWIVCAIQGQICMVGGKSAPLLTHCLAGQKDALPLVSCAELCWTLGFVSKLICYSLSKFISDLCAVCYNRPKSILLSTPYSPLQSRKVYSLQK